MADFVFILINGHTLNFRNIPNRSTQDLPTQYEQVRGNGVPLSAPPPEQEIL